MQYEVLPLFERGKRKPKKAYSSAPRINACVQMNKSRQSPLGREATVAHAYTGPGISELPELYDAHVNSIAVLAFTIEGVEFIEGQMYQQAWHCRLPEDKIQVPWSLCPRGPLDELL